MAWDMELPLEMSVECLIHSAYESWVLEAVMVKTPTPAISLYVGTGFLQEITLPMRLG